MQSLHRRIREEGRVVSPTVLKVDSFLNHQVDPAFIMDIGKAFAARFAAERVDKVLTVEASGIHIAMATALCLDVPFVYAKKRRALTQSGEAYSVPIVSYTRGETVPITISKTYLRPGERVLIVDDILARGGAILGLCEMIRHAGAHLVGVGVVIEKSFQEGRRQLDALGVPVCALARILRMGTDGIEFLADEGAVDAAPNNALAGTSPLQRPQPYFSQNGSGF
ncbi:xanthine phosphoribosyltransferase [Alicyclobacillus shizuokensis]|uniref:xanthine phosphoribosyltransferase n=1 Tax=Alicyclobacillus shizuokensis TaxID=392014 RepID=UPI0009FB8B02|nr:xanthine phosphoribosyltransferase [Alicyclobacillus shizuokensis]MCL6627700.1 xanthine phosphoribosyltransferase [Alicyclobacillus shizuokensis]